MELPEYLMFLLCKKTRPQGYKTFFMLNSTELSEKFQLLIKSNMPTDKEVSCFSLSRVVFIMLINVKMPTIVGILTFMSRINFVYQSY